MCASPKALRRFGQAINEHFDRSIECRIIAHVLRQPVFDVWNVETSTGELGRSVGSRGSRSSESDSDDEEVLIV